MMALLLRNFSESIPSLYSPRNRSMPNKRTTSDSAFSRILARIKSQLSTRISFSVGKSEIFTTVSTFVLKSDFNVLHKITKQYLQFSIIQIG